MRETEVFLEETVFSNMYIHKAYYTSIEGKSEKDVGTHFVCPYNKFVLVVSGYGRILVDESSVEITEGDIVIVTPNVAHSLFVESDTLEFASVEVDTPIMSSNMQLIHDEDECQDDYSDNCFHVRCSQDKKEYFEYIFRHIITLTSNHTYLYKPYSKIMVAMLIISIFRYSKGKLRLKNINEKNTRLEYVKKYLDSEYGDEFTLDRLARMSRYNKYTLIRDFKQKYGSTPIDYLQNVRIENAKYLLVNSDMLIAEVATEVGYHSQSYFNQVFKKLVGVSPTKYKKNNHLKKVSEK